MFVPALLLLIGCVVSAALTFLVRALAPRFDLTDRPDGHRKLHERAVPLGGGVAVFLAAALVLGWFFLANPAGLTLRTQGRELAGLLAAGLVIVLVGLVDDRLGLRGRHKVLGQLVAIGILIANGLVIDRLGILGGHVELGLLAIPFTCFWLLGATNSINLLDGIDGLAAMLGIVLVSTFAIMAALVGQSEIALVAWVFAGCLLGFIRFNYPPASIYLGDAGSMLIGLVLGALAIQGSLKGPGTLLLAAPLAVFTLPILDCAAAILRRKLTGRSICTTDRGHLHHQLLQRLGSPRRVLAVVTLCCVLTSSAALASMFFKADWIAFAIGPAIVVVFIATGVFGRAEFLLVLTRLRSLARSFLILNNGQGYARGNNTGAGNGSPGGHSDGHSGGNGNGKSASAKSVVRLQGSANWGELWTALTDQADELSLTFVRLDINLPMLHEGYSGTWERPFSDDTRKHWCLEVPLMVVEQRVGHVAASGYASETTTRQDIGRILELVEACETHVCAFMEHNRRARRLATSSDGPADPLAVEMASASGTRADGAVPDADHRGAAPPEAL